MIEWVEGHTKWLLEYNSKPFDGHRGYRVVYRERDTGYWVAVYFNDVISSGRFLNKNCTLANWSASDDDIRFDTKEEAMALCERHNRLMILQ